MDGRCGRDRYRDARLGRNVRVFSQILATCDLGLDVDPGPCHCQDR